MDKENENETVFVRPFGCGIPPNAERINWEWNEELECFMANGFPVYPPYDRKTTK